jgi:hypothetical protein
MFADINKALRNEAYLIAQGLVPMVQLIVRESGAAQAQAFVPTVKAKRDRLPLVAIGAVNPKFTNAAKRRGNTAKFTRRGSGPEASRQRRGSMAHGILFGPKGGHRSTSGTENYYGIPRREGYLAHALDEFGVVTRHASALYLESYLRVLRTHGWGSDEVKNGL